ncbi:hypothetical protein LCGC14_2038150, partial [marine sediment metagenome]
IYGYFKAMPGLDDSTEKYPIIEAVPDFFDFGEVEYGKIAEQTFKVKNSGSKRLRDIATTSRGPAANGNQIDPTDDTFDGE